VKQDSAYEKREERNSTKNVDQKETQQTTHYGMCELSSVDGCTVVCVKSTDKQESASLPCVEAIIQG
jgi:hypothetical protein